MPKIFKKSRIKVGLDLHNLSTRIDAVVRTGIQQVVFNLLKAQFNIRKGDTMPEITLVPLPMLPLSKSHSFFHDLKPTHLNNSELTLTQSAEELQIPISELWDESAQNSLLWSEHHYYETVSKLDWLIITGLCVFRHVVRHLKRLNPKLRIALLIYDLIPMVRPELTVKGMPLWFKNSYVSSILQFVDTIFTISRHTAIDCLHSLDPIVASKIPIIATPLPSEILESHNEKHEELLHSFKLQPKLYFVCLGTIEPRKNLGLAIQGFLRFLNQFQCVSEDFKMVIIGKKGWSGEDQALKEQIGTQLSKFLFPGYLERLEVEQLIQYASALIMPSRYEGYGMPLTLARELGVPTISCLNSSLLEASGFQTSIVPVDSVDTMALAMGNLYFLPTASTTKKDYDSEKAQKEWQNLLETWLHTLKNYEEEIICIPQTSYRPPARLKICIDVHNLSIDPDKLKKTGIQEVTYRILESLIELRKEFADTVEIIALPFLPESTFLPLFCTTCMCTPTVLQEVERSIGASGVELWGFDLSAMGYQINMQQFRKIISDADWFFITSQYDMQRCYPYVKAHSPNLKVSHIIYDVIPTLFPELVMRSLGNWFTYTFLRSVQKHSSLAITISHASAQDLLNRTESSFPEIPVYSRLLPCNQNNGRMKDNSAIPIEQTLLGQKHFLNQKRFFMVIGSTDPRKNTVNIILGFMRMQQIYGDLVSQISLVIVGPQEWRTENIHEALEEARKTCTIIETGYLSDKNLLRLVAASAGILMPSRYEGFGMPLALAKSHGVPAMTACNSSLAEVMQADAVFTEPWNQDSLALGMFQTLQNTSPEVDLGDNWMNYTRDLIRLHCIESHASSPQSSSL